MGIFIYFLIGVMTTFFYGGIIIAVKPKFLPFRFNHKIPSRLKALSIWFGLLFVCLFCLIILLAIHGDFEQVTANSSQTFSAILGCILSTVWWVWAYKKLDNLEVKKTDQLHLEQLSQLEKLTFTNQDDQQIKNNQTIFDTEVNQKIKKPSIVTNKFNIEKESLKIKPDCFIHYSDFEGNFSIREIDIQGVYQDGQYWYVEAYCYDAEDERTFRLDRIKMLECEHLDFHSFENKEIGMFLKKNF